MKKQLRETELLPIELLRFNRTVTTIEVLYNLLENLPKINTEDKNYVRI